MKTEKQIVAWMRSQGMSGVVVKRVEKLMKQFSTPAAFFEASRGAISGAYSKIAPGNSHGLGSSFWETFDKVLGFYKSKDDESDAHEEVREDSAVQTLEVDDRLVRLIQYKDLKSIVDMMEMLEIEAINLIEIIGFLSNVRFRQKATVKSEKPENPGGNNDKQGGQDNA